MRQFLLMAVCIACFTPGIFTLPPTDRDESRFVQASRQMLETGDYSEIRFQETPRYKKPIGIYWLHSAFAKLSGFGADSPLWVYRLVSVFGAFVAVFGVMWLGTRMFGENAGFLAAAATAGTLILGVEARIAKTDAVLLATVVISQASLANIFLASRQGRPAPSWSPWVFWIAQGFGVLVKGPITPLVSGLTIIWILIFDKDRNWLRSLRIAAGVLLLLAISAPWFVLISIKSGWEFWREAVGRDLLGKVAGGQESHGFPPGYYFLTFSVLVWPFAVQAVRGGLHALNRFRSDPRFLFLVAWYVPVWLFFELVPTKLPHYVLPAYPAIMIAFGWMLASCEVEETQLKRWQVWLIRAAMLGCILVTAGIVALLVGVPIWLNGAVSVWAVAASVAVVAAAWLGSSSTSFLPPMQRVACAAMLAAIFYGLTTAVMLPTLQQLWLSPQIATAFHKHKSCDDSVLVSVGYSEPSLVFLAGTKTMLTNPEGAALFLKNDPNCALVSVTGQYDEEFRRHFAENSRTLHGVATLSAVNYSKGDPVSVTLYRANLK